MAAITRRRVVADAPTPEPAPTPPYNAVEVEVRRSKVLLPPSVPQPVPLEQLNADPITHREVTPSVPPHKHGIDAILGLREELDSIIEVSDGRVIYVTITPLMIATSRIVLPTMPKRPEGVEVILPFGSQQVYLVDYWVEGNTVRWDGLALATILQVGDVVVIRYGVM